MTTENGKGGHIRGTPAFRPWPARLFVETTTRCNLDCRMCVKGSWDRRTMEGEMTDATFNALTEAFPHLEALVLNGVGEPLLDPRLERFIRIAKGAMPRGSWVGFQTNGMLLDEGRAISLVEAGLDRICLSADALSPETFREIRQGGEEEGVERAFAALTAAKVRCARPDLRVGLEFVLMRDNTRELPDLLRRAAALGASFAIVTHVLPYAEGCVPQAAYDSNMDGAVELFCDWRGRAEREGLDLGSYFRVLWKYMREPTDRDLAAFLTELAAAGPHGGRVDLLREMMGSSLPGNQITVKAFVNTMDLVKGMFMPDREWQADLERLCGELAACRGGGDGGMDRAEAKVRSWRLERGRGEAEFIRNLKTVWKYSRTPGEQRLYDMVEEMKGEARERGISLHLKNLMERDGEWAAEMERVFDEARVAAAGSGLDLRLPGTSPGSRRRCDFVEGGSAFVSWNGGVHPCYFLWHQYGCHLFGRKKPVSARSFGRVGEEGILTIWNSPPFRSFREEVLAYDYPYCSNCNVVPCQYLSAEEFEQDCYGNGVPCGDCFWCMGLFNCLQ